MYVSVMENIVCYEFHDETPKKSEDTSHAPKRGEVSSHIEHDSQLCFHRIRNSVVQKAMKNNMAPRNGMYGACIGVLVGVVGGVLVGCGHAPVQGSRTRMLIALDTDGVPVQLCVVSVELSEYPIPIDAVPSVISAVTPVDAEHGTGPKRVPQIEITAESLFATVANSEISPERSSFSP